MLPVKVEHIAQATRTDWPAQIPDHLQPYFARHNEFTVEENCLLWGILAIVPLKLRHHVLDKLNLSHLGIVCTRFLAHVQSGGPILTKA